MPQKYYLNVSFVWQSVAGGVHLFKRVCLVGRIKAEKKCQNIKRLIKLATLCQKIQKQNKQKHLKASKHKQKKQNRKKHEPR